MNYGLRLITGPAVEALTVDEVKQHLRIDRTDEDQYLADLIKAARSDLDAREGRLMGVAMITQTWELVLDAFPILADRHCYGQIDIPLRPLQSITSVKYDDVNGAEQTFPSTDYIVDTASWMGRVVLKPSKSWPGTSDGIQAVRVRFVCGYGAAGTAVPYYLRQAMLVKVAHHYRHRGDGGQEPGLPPAYHALIGVRGSLV